MKFHSRRVKMKVCLKTANYYADMIKAKSKVGEKSSFYHAIKRDIMNRELEQRYVKKGWLKRLIG
jgi:hypothetical protein